MKPLKAFDIQFVGLKLGSHQYEYKIEQTFFELFEFEEYNSVDVKITIQLEKKVNLLDLHFLAEGFVNVNCDLFYNGQILYIAQQWTSQKENQSKQSPYQKKRHW